MRPKNRRSLSQAGGATRLFGDPELAEKLARAACPPDDFDPRALTHGFHTWPARLHPFTARELLALCPAGQAIYDPFMGGGTVLVEAMVAGRRSVGGDLSPLAQEVAWVRTRVTSQRQRRDLVAAVGTVAEDARARVSGGLRVPPALWEAESAWYDAPALTDAWALLEASRAIPDRDLRRVLRACLSSLLVKASRQVSDSVHQRDPEHAYVPRGRVPGWFARRGEELGRQLEELAARVPAVAPEPELRLEDARSPAPIEIPGGLSIVTSPPYPGVYDYLAHQQRRYRLLRLDAGAIRAHEMGARRIQQDAGPDSALASYQADLCQILGTWRGLLAADGLALLVVGDGESPEGPLRVLPVIEAAAREAGLALLAGVSQRRTVRSRMGKGRVKYEHTLAFRKEAGG